MWTYHITPGELLHDGEHIANGYSGGGVGKNAPDFERIRAVGPIPEGDWLIVGPPYDSSAHGPYILGLAPAAGTETFGRSGFLIHGDSRDAPGQASKGCIILPRAVREAIWESGDRNLQVLP